MSESCEAQFERKEDAFGPFYRCRLSSNGRTVSLRWGQAPEDERLAKKRAFVSAVLAAPGVTVSQAWIEDKVGFGT